MIDLQSALMSREWDNGSGDEGEGKVIKEMQFYYIFCRKLKMKPVKFLIHTVTNVF